MQHGALSVRVTTLLAIVIALIGVNSVALTYTNMGVTYDEPVHVYTGMEWWFMGKYTLEPLHPPLARAAVAGPMYAAGVLPQTVREAISQKKNPDAVARSFYKDMWENSHLLFYEGGDIAKRLILARIGVMPFYILSLVIVFLWSRRLFGNEAALASLFLYALIPNSSAHAGLATTDMPYSALFIATLYAFWLWLENPSNQRSVLLGIFGGLTVVTKFSALMHLPPALIFMALWYFSEQKDHPYKTYGKSLLPGVLSALFCIAAVYQFQPITPIIEGIGQVLKKNNEGHANIFLGEWWPKGNMWYFPVVWFFKTPLTFLLLLPMACMAIRGGGKPLAWLPAIGAASVMAISMTSTINIGVRHILPVDALLCIVAGAGVLWLARLAKAGVLLAAALLGFYAYDATSTYPDRLSYFNALAGEHPTWVASDSNFDWGQDSMRIIYSLKKNNIKTFTMCLPFTIKDLYPLLKIYFDPRECTGNPSPGWLLVSTDTVMLRHMNVPMDWLDRHTPVENIGRTTKLYYIKP